MPVITTKGKFRNATPVSVRLPPKNNTHTGVFTARWSDDGFLYITERRVWRPGEPWENFYNEAVYRGQDLVRAKDRVGLTPRQLEEKIQSYKNLKRKGARLQAVIAAIKEQHPTFKLEPGW